MRILPQSIINTLLSADADAIVGAEYGRGAAAPGAVGVPLMIHAKAGAPMESLCVS